MSNGAEYTKLDAYLTFTPFWFLIAWTKYQSNIYEKKLYSLIHNIDKYMPFLINSITYQRQICLEIESVINYRETINYLLVSALWILVLSIPWLLEVCFGQVPILYYWYGRSVHTYNQKKKTYFEKKEYHVRVKNETPIDLK